MLTHRVYMFLHAQRAGSLSDSSSPLRRPKATYLFDPDVTCVVVPSRQFFSPKRRHPSLFHASRWGTYFHLNGSRKGVPRERYGYHVWDTGYFSEESIMKRLSPQQVPTADAYPDGDTWLVNNCPLLLDYLVKQKYEDGSARVPSTVTFFVDSGVFKLCVNDKDAQASLYTSANTLQDALVATEKRLGENPADWRFWKRAGKAKKV